MDALTSYQPPATTVKQLPPPINGRGRPALRRRTKSQRAALAVLVLRGGASLRPTLEVVSKALEVSSTYIEAAAKLSPDQLRQLDRSELTISETRSAPEAPKPATMFSDVVAWLLTCSQAERAAVVGSVGVATTWDAIAAHL